MAGATLIVNTAVKSTPASLVRCFIRVFMDIPPFGTHKCPDSANRFASTSMPFTLVGLWVFPMLTGELAPVFPCPQLAAGFSWGLRDRPTFACSHRAGGGRLPPALPARRAPRLRRHTA